MTKSIVSAVLLTSTLALVGCTGGTTYGTGTSHEQATMKSLGNIFALSNDKEKITYNARPELVMPANRNLLPQPVQKQALEADPNWPVSPEQRIAAVRSQAPEPDEYGNLPVEYLTDTNKVGISKIAPASDTIRRDTRRTNTNSGGDEFINAIRDDANGVGEGKAAREKRDQIAFSKGVQRKFLTEPPVEYRTPSANADAGEIGVDKEVVDERVQQAKEERRAVNNGTLQPRGADF